ncbi:MAG: sulfurtransferase-like selenium metabolism protein YedF [Firmicutes bacterium]|nr:sulfurtransferase-like selenium metabolism protein YedF [Bacillota bacterium]
MTERMLDCRGMACPRPVLETKKALEEAPGSPLVVVVDNEAARENVSRFAKSAGRTVSVAEKDGFYHLAIGERGVPAEAETPACCFSSADGPVYFITTNSLGQGPPDLGMVLMKSLMVTLAEHRPVPAALLFLNTGVHLALEGSPVLEQLRRLAGMGTEILVCGTCLDYYKVGEKLAIGTVSNMYDINGRLAGPHKVITVG